MCLFSQQESRSGNEGGLSSEVREQGQTWEYLRGLVVSEGAPGTEIPLSGERN